jgi:hypothetical protein
MYTTKTKTYSGLLSLAEIKEHLHIDASDSSYDSELLRLTRTAISLAEKHCQIDLVSTTAVLEDYGVASWCYDIMESNISIAGITGTTNDVSTAISSYEIQKYNSYTRLVFDSCISADKIVISYVSGSQSLPLEVIHAVKIKVGELFDIDRNGYTANTLKASRAFERLLAPYVNHLT